MFLSINKIIRCASSVMIARFTPPCQADQSPLQPLLHRMNKKRERRDCLSLCKMVLSMPISRVLSWMTIYLVCPLPDSSSDYPGT